MREKDLIFQIKKFKKIKPEKEWILKTKSQILGKDFLFEKQFLFPSLPILRLIFSILVIILISSEIFTLARSSLPGEFLYPLKKVMEKGEIILLRGNSEANFKVAEKRLEELSFIAYQKLAKNLPYAIEEYKLAKEKIGREIAEISQKSLKPKKAREIAVKVKEISEKEEKVLAILGEKEITQEPEKATVELLMRDLRDIIEKEALKEIEELYGQRKYREALDKILQYSSNFEKGQLESE